LYILPLCQWERLKPGGRSPFYGPEEYAKKALAVGIYVMWDRLGYVEVGNITGNCRNFKKKVMFCFTQRLCLLGTATDM
jgi:hypothetical protein